MYLKAEELAKLASDLGPPARLQLVQEIGPGELATVRGSRKHQRSHDVTFFVFNEAGRVALIRKPSFPEGAWRVPSGGIQPNEPILTGLVREAQEELGVTVTPTRYVLVVEARFTCGNETEPWWSHVFTATVSGVPTLAPRDQREIAGARWGTLRELAGPIRRVLWNSGRGLFQYRALLTDAAIRQIELPRNGKA